MTRLVPSVVIAFFLASGVPAPVAEHRFDATRRWRFDYAWPDRLIALEVEGGVWTGGRHTRPAGFVKDMEKYNRAAVLGWRVVRVQPRDLTRFETVQMISSLLSRYGDSPAITDGYKNKV